MKTKELEAIGKRLLPVLPGFAVKGKLLFVNPVGHTLRGVFFNGSINPKNFYVQILVNPLFVPSEQISFNFGWRLGGPSRTWKSDSPSLIDDLQAALREVAFPFLTQIVSYKDVAESVTTVQRANNWHVSPYMSNDLITQQAIAYSLARARDIPRASQALERVIGMLDNKQVPWQHEMAERALLVKSQLHGDPATAEKQFAAWEEETARTFGLTQFR